MAYKVVLYSGKSVQIAWDTLKQQISAWDLFINFYRAVHYYA